MEVKPDSFLIDEALAVGDEYFSKNCLWRLREERHPGRPFLIATHNLQFIEQICDQAALLVEGRAVAAGGGQDVVRGYRDVPCPRGGRSSREINGDGE